MVEVGHGSQFFFNMEKIAFIIDGGYFTKKYKANHKKSPTADDVEKYILKVFEYLKDNLHYPIEIYRIFYYDCPPFHSLASKNKPPLMEDDDFKKICETSKRKSEKIKKFHDKMKRKDFFALRMGQLQFVDWTQSLETKYWHPKFKQKGVDMRIGLDIASITAKKLCSKIVLLSGDTDIVPAMKIARKEGVHVYWYSMDDGRAGSNINLAMHSDVVITNKQLKTFNK